MPQQLQVQLSLCLDYLHNFSADDFHGFVVSVLNLDLFFEVKGELHDALLFCAAKVFDNNALIVMLESDAVKFLFQFSILKFGFVSFGFFFVVVVFSGLVKRWAVECELGTGFCGGLVVFFE